MRPERVKRAPTAADGTVLSTAPVQKKARLSRTPASASSPQRSAPSPARKRNTPSKSTPLEASSDSDDEKLATPARRHKSASSSAWEDLPDDALDECLPHCKRRVLSILTGELPPPGVDERGNHDGSECIGLKDQWANLRTTVKGTLLGEGNSALLIGTHGSGKSMLFESVLRSVGTEKADGGRPYHLVQLDGAIQTTDRLSMRELARQLVKQGAIKMPKEGEQPLMDFAFDAVPGEDVLIEDGEAQESVTKGYGLNENEGNDEEREAIANAVLSSLANTTSTILTLLSTGADTRKSLPLIITLSSFDLYTSRPRQALLYVLLDAVQAGSYTPGLCVIGMTSRLDTTDLLEKRVRSRFGGRVINVYPEGAWAKILRQTLLAGLNAENTQEAKRFNQAWLSEVEAFCADTSVLSHLDEVRASSNVVRTLHKTIYPVVAAISSQQPSLQTAFAQLRRTMIAFSSYSVLSDLTVPEFAVLIASKQLLNRDREVFNFEMCFDELRRFVAKIEMDRLGAASYSTVVNSTPDSSRKRVAGLATGVGLGWQSLTDRKRVMMAFRSLLSLEIFQPEASLNSLSFAAPTTSTNTGGPASSAAAVRTEHLRVKCTIFPQDIIAAAKQKNRREALGIHLVQWASSQG